MRIEQVICDQCGKDLTYRSNTVDYRLIVDSEPKPLKAAIGEAVAVTAMMLYPPVGRRYHFCGLKCLRAHPIATGEPSPSDA